MGITGIFAREKQKSTARKIIYYTLWPIHASINYLILGPLTMIGLTLTCCCCCFGGKIVDEDFKAEEQAENQLRRCVPCYVHEKGNKPENYFCCFGCPGTDE